VYCVTAGRVSKQLNWEITKTKRAALMLQYGLIPPLHDEAGSTS